MGDNETRTDKTSRRRIQHSTKGSKNCRWETKGDEGRQDPREGGHTIQHKEQERVRRETRGDKTVGKTDRTFNEGKQEGVRWETRGDKTVGKAGAPSSRGKQATKGNKKGYNGRQGKTRPSGKRTHHPTKGNKKGYNGGDKGKEDPRTHHPTKGSKKGYNGRQDTWEGGHSTKTLDQCGHTIQEGVQWGCVQEGARWEPRLSERLRTIQEEVHFSGPTSLARTTKNEPEASEALRLPHKIISMFHVKFNDRFTKRDFDFSNRRPRSPNAPPAARPKAPLILTHACQCFGWQGAQCTTLATRMKSIRCLAPCAAKQRFRPQNLTKVPRLPRKMDIAQKKMSTAR